MYEAEVKSLLERLAAANARNDAGAASQHEACASAAEALKASQAEMGEVQKRLALT